ncbi:WD40 repeat-like protein, partial [Rhizopogon vinicolor AM-OR11-026]
KLISGLFGGSIRILDTATWEQIAVLEGHTKVLTAITLSHNNRLLASASRDDTARLWDLDTCTTSHQTMRGHTNWVRDAVHLPDGRQIITCSNDGSLRLWDLESSTQLGDDWRDEGEKAEVNTITLSPNGKSPRPRDVSGLRGLWGVETGKVISRWTGHASHVWSVCWSPDGERLVSGSLDGKSVGCYERRNFPGANRDWPGGVCRDLLARWNEDCDGRISQ